MLKYSNSIHSAGFRGIYFGSVDTALTRGERENRNQLRINYLRFIVVPRTGLEPARLSTLAPETSASTIPPPGLGVVGCRCHQRFDVGLSLLSTGMPFVDAKLFLFFGSAKFLTLIFCLEDCF